MKRYLLCLLFLACGVPEVPLPDDDGGVDCNGHVVYDGQCTYVPNGPGSRHHFDGGLFDAGWVDPPHVQPNPFCPCADEGTELDGATCVVAFYVGDAKRCVWSHQGLCSCDDVGQTGTNAAGEPVECLHLPNAPACKGPKCCQWRALDGGTP